MNAITPIASKIDLTGLLSAIAQADASRRYDATTRAEDPALARARRIRSSVAWQRLRGWHLRRYPLCCDPYDVHRTGPVPAVEVHHIAGLAEAPDRAFDSANLASLCVACHRRVEGDRRAGKPTAHMFTHRKLT